LEEEQGQLKIPKKKKEFSAMNVMGMCRIREKQPAGKTQSHHRALFIPKEGKETLEVNMERKWSYDRRLQGSGVGYARGRY
jgi:hypothetical protein